MDTIGAVSKEGPMRRVRRSCVVLLCLVLLTGPAAAAPDEPKAFVAFLGDKVVSELSGTGTRADRVGRFQDLLDQYLAIPTVARFVTGPHWEKAAPEARDAFRDAFRTLLVNRFLPAFEGSQDVGFDVRGVRSVRDKLWQVKVRVQPPDGEPVAVALRVLRRDGRLQVADVITQGVSLALTLREEYTTYLRRHDGDLTALTRKVRERADALGS
jgi:phospholipid transport system substrate-binding protein